MESPLPHKVVVELVTRNRASRRLFSFMDDIFYGKRPKPKAPPKWAQFNNEKHNLGSGLES
jgi:hypothetical protein